MGILLLSACFPHGFHTAVVFFHFLWVISQKGSAMHLFFCFASWETLRAELLLQHS